VNLKSASISALLATLARARCAQRPSSFGYSEEARLARSLRDDYGRDRSRADRS
jgi:hypothetical protein